MISREQVYAWVSRYSTFCKCGETRISAWDFSTAEDLLDWLDGKEIARYGLLGCCQFEEDDDNE